MESESPQVNRILNACSICGVKKRYLVSDFSLIKTAHSKTPIPCILDRLFAKANISLCQEIQELTRKRRACQKCLMTLDEYDLAYTTATEIENKMIEIIKDKYRQNVREEYAVEYETNLDTFESQDFKNALQEYDGNPNIASESVILCKIDIQHVQSKEHESKSSFPIEQQDENNDAVDDLLYNSDDCSDSDTKTIRKRQPHMCTICFKKFSTKIKMNNHLKEHSSIHECETCKKVFPNNSYLDIHRNIHMEKSELECRYCLKTFRNRYRAMKHNRIHSKVPEFQCHLCGKQYIHYSSFHLHLKIHDDIRPYSCEFCRRLFRVRAHLNKHKLTHTGEKPFQCEICSQKFSQRYNLEQHKKRHLTGEDRYKCKYCDDGFPKQNYLNDHIKEKHYEIYQKREQRFFLCKTRKAIYENETTTAVDSIDE